MAPVRTELETLRRTARLWFLGSAIVPLAALAWAALTPAEWWYRFDEFRVHDAVEGDPVMVTVRRTVGKGGPGVASVQVYKFGSANKPEMACASPNIPINYRADASLPPPEDQTLRWWMFSAPCSGRLSPGRYLAQTTIRFDPPGYFDKIAFAEATFTILPRP